MHVKHSYVLTLWLQKENIHKMKILNYLMDEKAVKALNEPPKGHFVVDDSLSLAFALSASFKKHRRRIMVVTPNLYQAQKVYEQVIALIGEEDVLFYPFDEVIRVDSISSSKEMLSQRLYVIEKALERSPKILITHVSAALRNLPSCTLYVENKLCFKKGEHYNLRQIANLLNEIGFLRVSKIDQSLQYAMRGDILDIFPINYENPFRLEFFDDELESIRILDIASQISHEADIDDVTIFPASELLFKKDNFDKFIENVNNELKKEYSYLSFDKRPELKSKINGDIEKIKDKGFDETTYPYFYYYPEKKETIFDYFSPETIIYHLREKIHDSYEWFTHELNEYFEELFQNALSLKNVFYFQKEDYLDKYEAIITSQYALFSDDYSLPIRSIPYVAQNIHHSFDIIRKYQQEGKKVLISMDSSTLKIYEEFLKQENIKFIYSESGEIHDDLVTLYAQDFKEGFEFKNLDIVILTAKELLGRKILQSRYLSRYKKAEVLNTYEDLSPGDYIVHEEHGIGQFVKIETLDVGNGPRDYLMIQYAGTEVLYVPLEKFNLIRKYVGKEGAVPKISHLGGQEWKKTKAKMKARMNNIADRLIALYAARGNEKGIAFAHDDELQKSFEDAFPYPLTTDQIRSLNEIKKDMESTRPMDRLLCGDVGFGKTEVAFRAAFKAILSNKQVMLLCPTTLLARQHYEVAYYRFSPFGVKIAIFSRLIPEKQQNEQLLAIKKGEIQLIIGTHRLLSLGEAIPNLGLLIVDEEQRFGVEHKEKIKEISKNIDVLTLTATPIPRTLQMSLIGVRSLSTIDVPPQNRMPIQTYVMPYSEKLVVQVIERELARDGQVFYLHNRVASIYHTADYIQRLIPKAKIGVVHGRMEKDEIDDVMMAYYRNELNILVCTSIIETGLDIPNANTIIIENADLFGLSQLYQIKGRVGRSSRVAYAYLLVKPEKELQENANKRLKAIKDFTELGSGYKIAQRDLNIRGAGDILGSEQSGFIDTVGMDMYFRILKEVMDEKKGLNEGKKEVPSLPLSIGGYIPSNYAQDQDKIQLYQEIIGTNTIKDLELLKRKIRDVYGRIPKEMIPVFQKREIDILACSDYIDGVIETQVVKVILSKNTNKVPLFVDRLAAKIMSIRDEFHPSIENGHIVLILMKDHNLIDNLLMILRSVEAIKEEEDARR